MIDDEDIEKAVQPKKGKGRIVKGVLALVLLGAGSGGAYAYFNPSVIGHGPKSKEANVPQLLLKGESDPYAPAMEAGEEGAVEDVEGEGGSKYRTAYYTFSDDFTSNLKNSIGLIQISIAASTHRDGRVLQWLKKHELAARSKILTVLADTPEEEIMTQEGKDRLQKRLTAGINEVLTEAEGFGGVDNVYFRSLLVQ